MPLYDFRAKNGDTIERFYPIDECPKSIRVKGRRYERIISLRTSIMVEPEWGHVAYQFDEDDAKAAGVKLDPQTGSPDFRGMSKADIRQAQGKINEYRKGAYKYDFGIFRQ